MTTISKFVLSVICTLIFVNIYGQSKNDYLVEANKAFEQQNYHGALVYFDEALKFDNNDPAVVYKTAESARLYNAYAFASTKYVYLLDTLKNNEHPDAICRLGEMYHKLGRFDEAIQYYNQYLSEYSNADMKLTTLARRGVASATKAKSLINVLDPLITIEHLGPEINSTDADFGASDLSQKMYFSSLRFESDAKALRYKQIAKTLVKQGEFVPGIIDGPINNRDKSVANFQFTKTGNKVYYSVCDYTDGWKQTCEIYSCDIDGNGTLSKEVKLPTSINQAGSTNTQPAPGIDLASGKEGLFFVSDRSGGLGGLDIWFAAMENDTYSDPINIGIVNTDGNDITPYFHYSASTLYFSSDSREGFGGFDVFRYNRSAPEPQFMPAPVNTSMNDMYYFINYEGNKGYVTSNRAGSVLQYDSYEACCMDIYSVKINTDITLDVLTFLQADRSPLNGTTICLYDDDTGKEIECLTNSQLENKKSFILQPNRNYKIIAKKAEYTTAMERFSTTPLDKLITKKLYLDRDLIKLEVFTFADPSKEPLSGTTVTLTDLTDGSVQEIVVTNNEGNDYKFDIIAGRRYKVSASKPAYISTFEVFGTEGAKGTIRKNLYLPSLFPLSLYFDNDYPNPRSRSANTTYAYSTLVDDYLKRQSDYINNFIGPLRENEKETATKEIESFFKNDVQGGKDRFILALDHMLSFLQSGGMIEVEVRGYASPRAETQYNKILSKRRIKSAKNEIELYNSGALNPYLKSGKLVLKDVSFGESKANPNVTDDLNDERNSIYNLDAARERRVEIIKLNYKK